MNKSAIRSLYLAKRAALSSEEVKDKSNAIYELLLSRLAIHRFDSIHCFFPIQSKNEVDSTAIIQTILTDFPTSVYIPKVISNGEMTHHLYDNTSPLLINEWGVPEPVNKGVSTETFFQNEQDILVIVPLLAFDKKGHRVGYGKGYYDRFLSLKSKKTISIGLSFFEANKENITIEENDVALDLIITAERIYTFN